MNIKENYVLDNIKNKLYLPTDNYTLGNDLFYIFTIARGVISVIGVLGVVLLSITKRK